MGISSSLYSSISGLNTMGNSMSVIGDNVANVNTIAFKASRATFQDVLSQSVSTASGSAQVGRGVTLSTVDGLFAQGSFESSSNPTDMAIGGQGFFMIREPGNAEADNYTRAGEFRFDQEGYLVNPAGYFVQGWQLDTTTGERIGTIGDINISKSTPPVATDRVEVIVNIDSREDNENTELRLYDAWDGTNVAAVNPTDPISSTNYEYTTSVKIYDSIGASHDLTIYFDRTTTDNQWEYLITCDPSEDYRYLNASDQTIYAPDDTYNYQNHKGAGALQYGVIDFSTSGDVLQIDAFNIPPDGEVDVSQTLNRVVLNQTDQYYAFDVNFTGDTTNDSIELNFGARYSGQTTNLSQIIVSDAGVYDSVLTTDFITSETTWNSVFDSSGSPVEQGDQFTVTGFMPDGTAVTTAYQVPLVLATYNTTKVQVFLTQVGTAFGCTASIDASGRLRLEDNNGGDSALAVTAFTFVESVAPPATFVGMTNPFGTQINVTTAKRQIQSTDRALTTNSTNPPVISAATTWNSVYTSAGGGPLSALGGETIIFNGFQGDGTSIVNATFTTTAGGTVQELLDWIETNFNAEASIDYAGRLVLADRIADTAATPSQLRITSLAGGTAPLIFGGAAQFYEIPGDISGEDGSRAGDITTTNFDNEALASTQYANASTTVFQDQDGYASGFLQSVSTDTDGVITGQYSNGQVLKRAQVALATFNNLAGLFKEGGNIFTETTESGAPVTGAPGTNGLGSIAPNALEQSNVDIGTEFVKLITTQRGFQANSKIISTTDEMLADLINIKR